MTTRPLRALRASALLVSLGGCALIAGLDAPPNPLAPADAQPGFDAPSSEGGPIGDAATDAPRLPYCGNVVRRWTGSTFYCQDFDAITSLTPEFTFSGDSSMLSVGTRSALSPPRAMLIDIPAIDDAGNVQGEADKTLSAPSPTEAHLHFAWIATQRSTSNTYIFIFSMGQQPQQEYVDFYLAKDGTVSARAAIGTVQQNASIGTVVLNAWNEVDVDLGPTFAKVSVNGQLRANLVLSGTVSGAGQSLRFGNVTSYGPAAAQRLAIDDVSVELR